jgi:hypothetical protein
MIKAGYWKQLDFVDPYWTSYFFNYLEYDQLRPVVEALAQSGNTPDQIGAFLVQSNFQAVSSAFPLVAQTGTGRAYAEYIAPGPPGLRISNSSPNAVNLQWSPVAIRFAAEQRTDLASGFAWSLLPAAARSVGSDFSLMQAKTNESEFFRLQQPPP